MTPGRMTRKHTPAACPFCEAEVARPAAMDSEQGPDSPRGARCACGALYLMDATGKQGGQVLLAGLAMLCDGDVDRAMSLRTGIDYELTPMSYNPRTHSLDRAERGRRFGVPKLWFFRRLPASPP